MIVRGSLKKYIGAIEDEDVAGVLYDKYAIIIQGIQVSGRTEENMLAHSCNAFLYTYNRPKQTTPTPRGRSLTWSIGATLRFIKNLALKH